MKIAIFSDIHGNLEALVSVLQDIEARKCGLRFCLGDVVGYGANPSECVALLQANSIPVLKGNHDEAASLDVPLGVFNPVAAAAMMWTRHALSRVDRDWLQQLPYKIVMPEHRMSLYHANGLEPEGFEYICNSFDAGVTLGRQSTPLTFVGHTHQPKAYFVRNGEEPQELFTRTISLQEDGRYLINVGSVGQPRDGNSKACYVVYDTEGRTVSFIRLDYALAKAQQKIRKARLPERLAERLAIGE